MKEVTKIDCTLLSSAPERTRTVMFSYNM